MTEKLIVKYSHVGINGTSDKFPHSSKRYSMSLVLNESFKQKIMEHCKDVGGEPPIKNGLLKLSAIQRPDFYQKSEKVRIDNVPQDSLVMVRMQLRLSGSKVYANLLEVHLEDTVTLPSANIDIRAIEDLLLRLDNLDNCDCGSCNGKWVNCYSGWIKLVKFYIVKVQHY